MEQLRDKTRRRLTSVREWELPKQTSAVAPEHVWTNRDMDPTPVEEQTWSVWVVMGYWMTDTINLATWQVASGILAVGLSWREAIPCMLVGTICVAVPMVLNGAIGSDLHIPFAVITAASFGYWLRYFCVVSRAVLAMFWFGIQSANGAQCVTIMLRALAPSYNDMPNRLPAGAGIDSKGLVSYLIFWLVQLPLLFIHPTRLRPLFWLKLVSAPVAAIATMAWSVRQAGGAGDIFALRAEASGGTYALLWLTSMSSVTGSWATMACNIPDFTRYARSTRGQFVQLPFLPIVFTLCGVLGIVTTSASKVFTGSYVWNPLDIVALWLDMGSGGRCAAFFVALAWYVAQVGTNITTNTISAANDMTVMFPRWINIKRGSVIVALIGGWAFVPWKILASAMTFLAFMGGYAVFLAPISGIMVADYWLVARRRYDVPALYDPDGRYRYRVGCNWRAAVAFVVPVVPLLPGLALSISGPTAVSISQGAQNLYSVNWLFGFILSMVLYTGLSLALPAKELEGSVRGAGSWSSPSVTYADPGAKDEEEAG